MLEAGGPAEYGNNDIRRRGMNVRARREAEAGAACSLGRAVAPAPSPGGRAEEKSRSNGSELLEGDGGRGGVSDVTCVDG